MSPDPIDTVIEGGTLVGPDGTTETALGVDDGRIVERGPHKDLLQQEGTYARLYDVRS